MKKVGVTGGIGSGKTTVCRIFETQLGIPVYYSDENARRLMNEDPEVVSAVRALLGNRAYTENGTGFERKTVLDREWVAGKVFADQVLLEKLNGIVHHAVRKDMDAWMDRQKSPYVIQEAAILIESGAAERLDAIIAVTAPVELRIRRVMARDGMDEAAVRRRMANQIKEEELLSQADYVIIADDEHPLVPQILEINNKLSES